MRSSLLIALAELCRYEAWAFASIIACGFVVREQRRLLPTLLPAVIVPLIWILTSDYRDVAYGFMPIRKVEPLSFLTRDLSTVLGTFSSVSIMVIVHTAYVLAWLGLPLVIWGIVISWKKGNVIGRELLVFLFGLFLLTIIRGVDAGEVGNRMPMLSLCISVVYLAIGLHDIRIRLPKASGKLLSDGITLAIVWIFVLHGYGLTKTSSIFFSPEAQAASLLVNLSEHLSDQERVIIIPRTVANPYGESTIGAIFANSMKLDPDDSRWIYMPSEIVKQEEREHHLLAFNYRMGKYTLTRRPKKSSHQHPPGLNTGRGKALSS